MADNAKAFAALEEHIRKIGELENLPQKVAPEVAKAAKQDIETQTQAQQGPDGRPWKPGKEGDPILKNAASAVKIIVQNLSITLLLTGRYARHHLGAVKGKIKRKIIPSANIPQTMTRAITKVIHARFTKIMKS